MRMMKRAAVALLTAAMALSMLTACGGSSGTGSASSGSTSGSNGGSSSSSSSSSGTNNGSSSSSGSSSSGSTSTKGDTTKLPDGTEISYQNSKARQYNMARYNSSSWYMKTERIYTKNPTRNYTQEQVSSGEKQYTKTTYPNDNRTYEYFYDGTTSYTLYSDLKIAITYVSNGTSTTEKYNLDSIKKTTRVENNVPYYTEVLSYKSDTTDKTMSRIYCFDSTGKLTYLITNEGTESEYKIHVLSYGTSIPSTAILSIPDNWEVYTSIYDENVGHNVVTDKSGRTLTDAERLELNKKIY